MNIRFVTTLLCGVFAVSSSAFAAEAPEGPGCVSFRSDDNRSVELWSEYTALFDKYGFHSCGSFNFASLSTEHVKFLKEFQTKGHEVMDHTPSHMVQYIDFRNKEEAAPFVSHPAVNHVFDVSGKQRVCLNYKSPDLSKGKKFQHQVKEGKIESDLPTKASTFFIYLPEKSALYAAEKSKDGTVTLKTFWGEKLDLSGTFEALGYEQGSVFVTVTDEALDLHAKVTRSFAEKYGITPPVSWIQPGGGIICWVQGPDFKKVFAEKYGYKAAHAYLPAGWKPKIFNEYDPDGLMKYGINWGDFMDDNLSLDIEKVKKTIADGVALHRMMVGHCHFPGDSKTYFARIDILLKWLKEENIPVVTMKEGAGLFYGDKSERFAKKFNIIPPLSADRNHDGIPDGYASTKGLNADEALPDGSKGSVSTKDGQLFAINGLGALPRGKHKIEFYAKGDAASELSLSWKTLSSSNSLVKLDSAKWKLYSVEVEIPEKAVSADLSLSVKGAASAGAFKLIYQP